MDKKLEKAKQLIAVSGAEKTYDDMVDAQLEKMTKAIKAANPGDLGLSSEEKKEIEEEIEELKAKLKQAVAKVKNEITGTMAQLYSEYLSEEEIDQLIEFYSGSSIGDRFRAIAKAAGDEMERLLKRELKSLI